MTHIMILQLNQCDYVKKIMFAPNVIHIKVIKYTIRATLVPSQLRAAGKVSHAECFYNMLSRLIIT